MLRVLFSILLLTAFSAGHASVNRGEGEDPAKTYQLNTIAVVRSAPDGEIIDIWNNDTLFTSNEIQGDWVRVTGLFPDGNNWQANPNETWINRYYISPIKRAPQPKPSNRPDGVIRYIEVDKSDFELRVVEERDDEKKVLLKTTVAVGMDRCLPKSKGGKCYYTEAGEYEVRWKVYDPKGIEWCIPKTMEKEYAADIAAGNRCFRGPIGSYALNIGKSYAIHGTSKLATLGKKVSHGCVRTANKQMTQIYKLVDVGDKVYITD